MLNIVHDTNNLFFRSTFTVGGFGKSKFTFDSQHELDLLMRKVSTDVSSIIRTVNPNRIIFAQDSNSWRKKISIDENEGYKGNRIKNEFINWNNIYKLMDEFGQILESNNFIVSKVNNAEADDLIALWANEILNNQKQHLIIVSGDEDVRQLVTSNIVDGKTVFCVVYNPFTQGKNATKKLYVPENFEEWLNDDSDPGDFFNRAIDTDKDDFKRILSEKIKMEVINGTNIALYKVFCGDDGDNVPAIYTWLTKDKNGADKEARITDSKYEKIINVANINNIEDLEDKTKQQMINEEISIICKHKPTINIKDQIERQLKLVVLNKKYFPKQIIDDFNSTVVEEYNKPLVRGLAVNMNSMLDGTKYVDKNYVKKSSFNESSIFNQLDSILNNKELF